MRSTLPPSFGEKPARILIVDDERTNRQLLEVMLGPEGFVLQTAISGEEALAMVAADPPDLILLDVMMNGMDGYEVVTTIKATLSTRNIPVIMVSALGDRSARMLALRGGAEDFLSKPVDPAELATRIRNLLRLKAYGDYHDKYGQMLEAEVGARTAALVESEQRYRRIVETTSEGVWLVDAGMKTTFMNARMAEMLGCDAHDTIGLAPAELLDDDGLVTLASGMKLSGARPTQQVELQLKKRDGSRLWALLEISPTFDTGGAFDGALVMVMDISGRRKTEEALRASESRLRRLWDSGLVLIAVSDSAGNLTDINEGGAGMLGYSRDELLVKNVSLLDLTPEEWKPSEEASHAQLLACGVATPWEKELLRKDGTRLPILVGAATVNDGERIGIAVDLSERKRAENANLERMRIASMTAAVGVALTHGGPLGAVLQRCAEAIVEHVGGAAARIWTYNARERMLELAASAGLPWEPGTSAARVPLGRYKVGLIAEQRRPHLTNDILNDPRLLNAAWAKCEGVVAFAGHPLLIDGELVGVVAMYARHPLGDAVLKGLGSVADEIAIGVQRSLGEDLRTSLESQLRQAQKMDAVGRLAGGLAHDFNNVLSVILSYGALMAENLEHGDPMRDDLDEIQKAGERAAGLTRQLLMFSRQQVLEPKVLDLNDLLASMDKMLKRILGADVELVSLPAHDLGRIKADQSSIEQVIMNLVVNARDAMPTGGKLTIETANVDVDQDFARQHVGLNTGPHLRLSVTDTGIGIDPDTQARIFEPFFTTKVKEKGTGLGLSTVFGIANQSGGAVWVSSEPGKGTTFEVYLPRVDELVPERHVQTASNGRGTETVLLVEDDDQVRLVARGILRRSGYHVIDARNAGEALLHCEQHDNHIHLLLTDVIMPQMSGPDLARRLTRDRPGMRVLCMSGYIDDSIVRHGVLEAQIAYLQKPLTPETLTRKVREVLDA